MLEYSGDQFLKVRYSTNPEEETFFEWRGSVTAYIPNQRPTKLFNCVGMNVAKAYLDKSDGLLKVTSRELTYYLAPDDQQEEKLKTWDNPFTNEKGLPMVHIANNLVQMKLPVLSPYFNLEGRENPYGDYTSFAVEIPLMYPNPLATPDGIYDDYDSHKMYQAGEYFTFKCETKEMKEKQTTIDKVELNWTRISPFAPFMKMGKTDGYLLYHCTGYKLASRSTFQDLKSPLLKKEIQDRMSLYAHAPQEYDDQLKSVSSWTYFKDHFPQYQQQLKDHEDIEWPLPEK
ncbi:unnamed protein product [Cunninghamella blakesleeana]